MKKNARIFSEENNKAAWDTYAARMENYRKRYYPEGSGNLYAPNGIKDLRTLVKKYAYLLKIIKKDGSIIDFGCGNGMMLKFLVMNARCRLVPYGVDFLKESVRQAKTVIFPEYKENFFCMNIADYNFRGASFDYILTNPDYLLEGDWGRFYAACLAHLNSGGIMILSVPPDDLARPRFAQRMKRFLSEDDGFRTHDGGANVIFFKENGQSMKGAPARKALKQSHG